MDYQNRTNRINAAEQSHNSAQAEMAMQEALLDVYKRQTDMLQLKAYLETNAATYSAYQTREQFGSAWGKGEKKRQTHLSSNMTSASNHLIRALKS